MVSLLAALWATAFQTPIAPVKMLGREIPVVFPHAPAPIPDEVRNWSGWKGLVGCKVLPDTCVVDRDFTDAEKQLVAPAADAPVWHLKVLIQRRYESDYFRLAFSKAQLDQVYGGIALAVREFESMTGLRVALDVEDLGNLNLSVQDQQLAAEARVNRGFFDPDDHRYRGPYHSTIWVSPDTVGNNPRFHMYDDDLPGTGVGALAEFILSEEVPVLERFLDDGGVSWKLDPIPVFKALAPELKQKVVGLAFQARGSGMSSSLNWSSTGRAPCTDDVHLSIQNVPERGKVLDLICDAELGKGQAVFFTAPPVGASGASGITRVVTFWAKRISGLATLERDPNRLMRTGRPIDREMSKYVANLGVSNEPSRYLFAAYYFTWPCDSIDIPSDSTWKHVALEIPGDSRVQLSLRLIAGQKIGDPPCHYQFADFQISDKVPSDCLGPQQTVTENIALNAKLGHVNPTSLEGVETLLAGLSSPVSRTQILALRFAAGSKDPQVQQKLISDLSELDGRIVEGAAEALARSDTDAGRDALLAGMLHGITEREKVACGKALAAKKNPGFLTQLSALTLLRDWTSRVGAIEAMVLNGGPNLQALLLGLSEDPEPEVRTRAVENLDPENPESVKKLQFAAVNDPSDWVRSRAYIRLLSDPKWTNEGLHGLQDDSVWVQTLTLQEIEAHPKAEYQAAVKKCLTSSDWNVRFAAVSALVAVPGTVQASELGDLILKDEHLEMKGKVEELLKKKS